MPLNESWVDRIFDRLHIAYGHDFSNRWNGFDMKVIKADWAIALAEFSDRSYALRFALENLSPDEPPTAYQFRNLARSAPKPPTVLLPPPEPRFTTHQIQAAADIAVKLRRKDDGMMHAQRLVERLHSRLRAGELLNEAQRHVLGCCERHLGVERPKADAEQNAHGEAA